MRKALILLICLTSFQIAIAQKKVAITMDDIPNTTLFSKENHTSRLLQLLDEQQIPIAIYINEKKLYKGDQVEKNFALLHDWIQKEYITLGNHSFSHARYSTTGFKNYREEVIKGESITKELAKEYNKPLIHFRFPFNDLGKDSTQQVAIRSFLNKKGYRISPFSVESSDWMFNAIYKHYLENNQPEKAAQIGNQYVTTTLAYFDFFENVCQEQYGRAINHIYLCHDNLINTDYLEAILTGLNQKGYEFISMDEALTDEVYNQPNHYYKKWGVSWLYRWMDNKEDRIKYMRSEPFPTEVENTYNQLFNHQ